MPQVDPKRKQKVAFVGKHDRSWVQPWSVMVLKHIRKKSSKGMIGHGPVMTGHGLRQNASGIFDMIGHGPAMIGHSRRQKCTGIFDMIGHGPAMTGHVCKEKSTLFKCPEMISRWLLLLQSNLKHWKAHLNYKTSLFKLKLITKPTNELIAR